MCSLWLRREYWRRGPLGVYAVGEEGGLQFKRAPGPFGALHLRKSWRICDLSGSGPFGNPVFRADTEALRLEWASSSRSLEGL